MRAGSLTVADLFGNVYARFKLMENAATACKKLTAQSRACELCPVRNLQAACCPSSGEGCVRGSCDFVHRLERSRNNGTHGSGMEGREGGDSLVGGFVKHDDTNHGFLIDE